MAKKILIVDDDRVTRALYKKELAKGGYEIFEASNGFEALHLVTQHEVDLVTLDIEMPDMDGYQVCTLLRGEKFSRRLNDNAVELLPIVFVTSDTSMDGRLKGFRSGATDFISKGFKPGALLEMVSQILDPENFLKGLTALLVEDSPVVLRFVARMLEEHGVKILSAVNGMDGFEAIQKHRHEVDLVITDLEMPVMKGDELCRKIRKDLGLKDLPVIFLTANPNQNVLIKLFHAGATDYLVKPFLKEELLARLKVTQEIRGTLKAEVAERERMQLHLEETIANAGSRRETLGKVQLASSVLHNIGNVLNSAKMSAAQLESNMKTSKIPQLLLALQLLEKHQDDMVHFLSEDPKGAQLKEYFLKVPEVLKSQHQQMAEEIKEMRKKIQLKGDMIMVQQKHAKEKGSTGGDVARLDLAEVVDEALKVQMAQISRAGVSIEEHYNHQGPVEASRTEVVHTLINLFKNGVEAMAKAPVRELWITSATADDGRTWLKVRDTGSGIKAEDMAGLFEHGFTTKSDGHGFGISHAKKALAETGGDLIAESDGPGKGAVFTLMFPPLAE